MRRDFFSSSVADVALMARSLHESKQLKLCTRTQSPWNQQIDWTKTTKTTTTQKATTRKSPSQTCVSPAETKQTAKQHQNQNKNGARAQTKHPPNRSAIGRSGISTASLSKTCKENELCIAAVQADMKTLARRLTLAWDKLYMNADPLRNLSQSPLRSAHHGPSWT